MPKQELSGLPYFSDEGVGVSRNCCCLVTFFLLLLSIYLVLCMYYVERENSHSALHIRSQCASSYSLILIRSFEKSARILKSRKSQKVFQSQIEVEVLKASGKVKNSKVLGFVESAKYGN